MKLEIPTSRALPLLPGLVTALAAALLLGPTALAADPGGPAAAAGTGKTLLLISQSELDALPSDTPVAWGTIPTSPDGPTIEIASPTHNGTYQGPFPIKVAFLPGPKGYEVDIGSLKLEYKKAWGIDITDRVREFITGTKIDVEESELPTGRHTVEIQIADVADNLSRQIFTVTIK